MNNIELTPSQKRVFQDAITWWRSRNEQTFEISGPPGSGKSFLINQIMKALNIDITRVAPMAYTGSAAINMRTKGMMNARTIFSWLYDFVETPVLDNDGNPILDPVFNKPKFKMSFIPKKSLPGIDLIIIDEAPMAPIEMRYIIDSMGIPVIAVGDLDQLPPVVGKPGYLTEEWKVHKLTEIMRQAESSTIVQFSQMILKGIEIPHGHFGNVDIIYNDELTDNMIANSDIIICGKNATRDEAIYHVRHDMLHYTSETPNYGERLVCRKNNWNIESGGINLTNGLIGNCISHLDASSFNRDDNTFKMSFKPDLKGVTFQDIDVDYRYMTSNRKAREALMQTRFSKGNKFEFGYAITTHMSQGSEFNQGIYLEEYLNRDINRKLHYVGITRFRHHCIYVKKRPKRFW